MRSIDEAAVRTSEARREAFGQATAAFTALVARVGSEDWQLPALGQWTVRDLVGHASRALSTIEAYLPTAAQPAPVVQGTRARQAGRPTDPVLDADAYELAGPADYYLAARASLGDPAAVAERGRVAGRALGADPAGAVCTLATRVLALVAATADNTLIRSPVGTMAFVDYLPTRTFELTVHGLDLARALPGDSGPGAGAPLGSALAAGLDLAAELAARGPDAADLLLLLTGRGSLRTGLSAL
ncbi:maleylpyruvate isomerase N-terminal domain-containing protein [Parafrankia elaeagni]|uniref:maleylpyruvate isomerase N-terminal domain-containing protein n=1 Tax=Parafrankia elaeagni TaxID=222534 RepID=UPI0003756A51|nr:maleylpyruvate isomerase N-terminal domain-containing protein [Parafrankia elaeagni]